MRGDLVRFDLTTAAAQAAGSASYNTGGTHSASSGAGPGELTRYEVHTGQTPAGSYSAPSTNPGENPADLLLGGPQ